MEEKDFNLEDFIEELDISISKEELKEAMPEYLGKLSNVNDHMMKIMNDFLEVSKGDFFTDEEKDFFMMSGIALMAGNMQEEKMATASSEATTKLMQKFGMIPDSETEKE